MAGLFGVFKKKNYVISSPMAGTCVPIEEVPDPTFAEGILGKGVAVIPSDGKVYAPADGVLTMVFSTGHAFSMTTDDGVEILVHVGLETVSLNGVPFKAHGKDGDKVKKGDLILEANLQMIHEAGCEIITPIVVCNSDDYKSIETKTGKEVKAGDEVMHVNA